MKKFGIVILSFLLSISLSAALTLYVLTSTLGNGQTVQSWLDDSEVINNGVKNALFFVEDLDIDEEVKRDIGERLEEPVAEKVIKPQVAKAITEFYDWLEAPSYELLNFVVELDSNNDEIIKRVGAIIEDHYDSLPECTEEELAKLEGEGGGEEGEDDEFILCRDPKINATELSDEIVEMLTENEGTLEPVEVEVEADTDADNVLQNVYDGVRIAKSVHILLVFAILLFGVPIIFLSKSYVHGIKRLARSFINALLLPVLITVLVIVFLPDNMFIDKIDFEYKGENIDVFNQAVENTLAPLMREIALDITKTYLRVALPLLILASGTWFYTRYLVKRTEKKEDKKKK